MIVKERNIERHCEICGMKIAANSRWKLDFDYNLHLRDEHHKVWLNK